MFHSKMAWCSSDMLYYLFVVGYTSDIMDFAWLVNEDDPERPAIDIEDNRQLPQFTLERFTQKDCSQNYSAGGYYIYWLHPYYYLLNYYTPVIDAKNSNRNDDDDDDDDDV